VPLWFMWHSGAGVRPGEGWAVWGRELTGML
jgi:hypothetical protein